MGLGDEKTTLWRNVVKLPEAPGRADKAAKRTGPRLGRVGNLTLFGRRSRDLLEASA